jgi:hypothetical protein
MNDHTLSSYVLSSDQQTRHIPQKSCACMHIIPCAINSCAYIYYYRLFHAALALINTWLHIKEQVREDVYMQAGLHAGSILHDNALLKNAHVEHIIPAGSAMLQGLT